MPPRQSTAGPPVIERRFEPSRLAGPLLSSAYEALVPVPRLSPGDRAAQSRPPAVTPAPTRPAIGA
jgi:hypothetical protein